MVVHQQHHALLQCHIAGIHLRIAVEGQHAKATNGCSSSGLKKYRVKEWIDYLAALEDPPSPALGLSNKTLDIVSVSGGVQVTSSTTLNADHRNHITLSLPGNVTYHNDTTGESQTGVPTTSDTRQRQLR